jgi:hypothetical protein
MIGQPVVKLIHEDRLKEEPMILDPIKKGEIVEPFRNKTSYQRQKNT